ncbi:hypothetical protein FQA39_LY16331 [Lamprigera yunnana]|nr:hypothetical protein FQA39_LY16331 [Lamprigera yunnana]
MSKVNETKKLRSQRQTPINRLKEFLSIAQNVIDETSLYQFKIHFSSVETLYKEFNSFHELLIAALSINAEDEFSNEELIRTEVDVDSVAKSCIQLAKERIIKYSDTKYNINDFKTGDCETMLLNQRIYYLNKSKSKWISVGLYHPFKFTSVVKIFGRSKQYVIFKEEEWIEFHEQRENINKYLQTCDIMWKPRQIGSKTLTFEMIKEKKILRIEDMCGNEVYLEFDTDHEAIYGMERWKVCRQFLKGKTCSQCLVKRMSDIGLRHFLDTINKYIKDCSDSDTSSSSSSNEKECKAVEKNGEGPETTKEEEEESKKSKVERITKPIS